MQIKRLLFFPSAVRWPLQRGLPGFPSTFYVCESFHIRVERQTASASLTSISVEQITIFGTPKGCALDPKRPSGAGCEDILSKGFWEPSRYVQEKKAHCIARFVIPTGFHTSRFFPHSICCCGESFRALWMPLDFQIDGGFFTRSRTRL